MNNIDTLRLAEQRHKDALAAELTETTYAPITLSTLRRVYIAIDTAYADTVDEYLSSANITPAIHAYARSLN